MTRYFTRPKAAFYVEDEFHRPRSNAPALPSVPDHEAADTGLLDANGDAILRAPNPMGFVWDDTP